MMRFIFCLVLIGCVHNRTAEEEAKLAVKRANNAVTVDEYRQRLLKCKAEGKDAGSLPVYERCAKEADTQYGLTELDGGN